MGSPGDLQPWICSEKSALCIHTNNSIWPMLGGILPLNETTGGRVFIFVHRLVLAMTND